MEPSLSQIIEAIIFVSDQPVTLTFLGQVLKQATSDGSDHEQDRGDEDMEETDDAGPSKAELEAALQELIEKYRDNRYPFEVKQVSGGYQFYTKRAYYPYVKKAVVNKNRRKLTRSALETLSIVAYRQPITKAEVEFVRGVNCDYALQKLLEKNLVSIVGRADAPGRPLLYATSSFFMEYFGMADMTELPKLKEFADMEEDHLDQFRQKQQEDQNETTEEGEETVLEEPGSGGATEEEAAPQGVAEAVEPDAGEAEEASGGETGTERPG